MNRLQMTLFSLIFFIPLTQAESLDDYLRQRLEFFSITPLVSLPLPENSSQLELGKKLFLETDLSGNRNISCHTCHNPKMGTSDALALSQTQDGSGILKRNSSSLFNSGATNNVFMFWDGRIQHHSDKNTFTTPEPALNGDNPKASHISSLLTNALAAQSIFPLTSREEMRGRRGENEIADAKNNLEVWDRLVKRLMTEGEKERYLKLFTSAYPKIPKDGSTVNIGHVAEAMAAFMKHQFQSNGSPFHRYVAGDNQAMNEPEKRGLAVFIDRGKCIACHQGNLLQNNTFFTSIGVPSYGAKPFTIDRGRGEAINDASRNFFFKTPSLINISMTAPYMHNGIFKTLRDVIVHYNNIRHSLHHFELTPERRAEFPVELEVMNDRQTVNEIFNSIQAPFLKSGLGLTKEEMDDLESFLSTGLSDPKWSNQQIKN